MSAYERLWELICTYEKPLVLNCFIKNKQKMLTFNISSLWYFANISVHISQNNKKLDIFWKMSKMEFLNPMDAKKFKKTEVLTVLPDTLYN